jgi:hypothetical protein
MASAAARVSFRAASSLARRYPGELCHFWCKAMVDLANHDAFRLHGADRFKMGVLIDEEELSRLGVELDHLFAGRPMDDTGVVVELHVEAPLYELRAHLEIPGAVAEESV